MTRLWIGQSGVQIPQGQEGFLFSKDVQTNSEAYPTSCLIGNGVLLPGVEWPGHEVGLSLVLMLRMVGATYVFPVYALMA